MRPLAALAALSEAELVERFRASGDGRFFEQLYLRVRRPVFAVCLRILRDPARAEDACHDAFLKAWERFATLEGDAFASWVRRIAANHCLNELRHERMARREMAASGEAAAPLPAPGPETSAAARDDLERAEAIVAALGDAQRRVFVLRHLDGMSYAEIAAATGLSGEAVRSHLQNARRNFRLAWEGRPAGGGVREGTSHG